MKAPKKAFYFSDLGVTFFRENNELKTFSILANTGQVIPNHYLYGPLVIDLESLSVGSQKKPVLFNNDPNRIVGYTTKITKDEKGLIAEGVFSLASDDGKYVYDLADEGFPWQASIYAPPLSIEKIAEGVEVKINGHKLKGPLSVFRNARLREISFCVLGADEDTSAKSLKEVKK
ncbi:MAG: hypothetical protein JW734_06525 [Candidatus Omnitrophica bacterium]|nr:hypothetical protein [Candidatus Omnitrophota bacterium]